MARRRHQKDGYLTERGPSWLLQWREDVRAADGTTKRVKFSRAIAPRTGTDRVSRREAERIAWAEVLSKLDAATQKPRSMATVAEFVKHEFEPQWVWSLTPNGRRHYKWCLPRILAAIGEKPMRRITCRDIQAIVREAIEAAGLSVQSALHLKNAVSAIFRHALASGYYSGENPAAGVRMPEMERADTHALSMEEARQVMAELPADIRELILFALLTGMNVSECAGLRWYRVNLTGAPAIIDGANVAGYCLFVCEQSYRGLKLKTKTPNRRRVIPLPAALVELLIRRRTARKPASPDSYVFTNSRGGAINDNNLRRRQLAPAGVRAGLSWPLSFHVFRRSAGTWAEAAGMVASDLIAYMGHGRITTTLQHYTKTDLERRRAILDSIAAALLPEPEPAAIEADSLTDQIQ